MARTARVGGLVALAGAFGLVAAVLAGVSSPALLQTYDSERRAIAWLRHDQTFARPDYRREAAGFAEVILYFNVGMKPHAQVKDEMDRFMREVAPAFEGKHKKRAA